MNIPKPAINALGFSKGFMLRRGRRTVTKYVDQIGKENLVWMIKNNKDLYQYIKPLMEKIEGKPADQIERELHERALKYQWINDAFTDEDVYSLFPDWVNQIITEQGPQGYKWMYRQIKTVRQFFL